MCGRRCAPAAEPEVVSGTMTAEGLISDHLHTYLAA